MTKAKFAIAGIVALAAVAAPIAQHQTIQALRQENEELKRQVAQIAPLQAQAVQAAQESARASNAAPAQAQVMELVRLRGQVRVLQAQTNDLAQARQQVQSLNARMAMLQQQLTDVHYRVPSDLSDEQQKEAAFMNQCISNLRIIDGAKQQWALEFHKQITDTPTEDDIRPYMGRGPQGEMPQCSEGGTYIIGAVGVKPTCTIAKHALP